MSTRVREVERRLTALALVLAVFGAAYLTLAVSTATATSLVTWWPAVGIAATLVLVTPPTWWWWILPLIVAANASANLLFDRPPQFALTTSLAVALESFIFAVVMRHRPGGVATLANQTDFLRLVAAVAVATGIGGAAAAIALPLAGGSDSTRDSLLAIWPSHAASILVLAPVLMSLRRPLLPIRIWELVLQTSGLTVISLVVFWLSDVTAMTFAPIPFLVWAAFQFGLRVVAVQVAVVGLVASASTAWGRGPFAVETGGGRLDPMAATSLVQTFLVCIVLICVPLAVNVEQALRLTDKLRASGDLFRRNFSESLVAMLVLRGGSAGFEIYDANQQTTTLLGLPRPDVIGRPLDDVLDTEVPLQLIARQMAEGQLDGWRGEGTLPHRPESQIALSITQLSGSTDEPMFSAQLLDLTAERVARADLDAERQLSDMTLATTACLIVVADVQGMVKRVNPAVCELLGASAEELRGQPIWDLLVVPEYRLRARSMFVDDGHALIPSNSESTLIDAEGREHLVSWTSGIVNDATGQPDYVVMTGLDVTAERNASGLTQHLLAAALDTALIGVDLSGRITLFNSGAEMMLASRAFEAIGSPFVDLLDPAELTPWSHEREGHPSFETLRAHLVDQPPEDWTWRRSDGQRARVSMSLSRVTDHSNTLIGYLCVGSDVTASRATQEMLATALDKERQVVERLTSLDAAKDDFVSTVSHELRTPVASIVGYTELLQDGDFGAVAEKQVPVLDAINRNGERLVNLVDNLLALNGLASERLSWERGRVDLVDLIHSVQRSSLAWEAARRLDVAFETPDHPVHVEGDWPQLERALSNLLSNAMKFTEPRGRVTCRLSQESQTAVLVVSDTGLGIPLEEQENLFKRFWRSSTAQSRHIQGTGLGLSIVQAIVSAHSGSVSLESEHLKGTTVTVRLPVSP